MAKMVSIKALARAVKSVKSQIHDDFRAFEEDEIPGIQLTIGYDDKTGEWAGQTGDNSYTGNAYGYPHWAVVGVYRNSNSIELARDIQSQLYDLISQ